MNPHRAALSDQNNGQAGSPSLSVIIPAFNEEECLPTLMSELNACLERLPRQSEVIIVDDGSSDGTALVVEELITSHPRLRYIAHSENRGKAAALSTGFKAAKGEYLVTMDADGQDDPAEIPALLSLLKRGNDMVCGWRSKRRDGVDKTLPSRIFNTLTRVLSGVGVHDSNCGLKAYRREAIDGLELDGGLHRYMPFLVSSRGFRVTEVAVNHRPRIAGSSKYNASRILPGLLDLLALTYRLRVRPVISSFATRLSFLSGARKWLTVAQLGVSVTAVIYLLTRQAPADLVSALTSPDLLLVLLALLLLLLGQVLSALKWRYIVGSFGTTISVSFTIRAYATGVFYNSLLPWAYGGDIGRAVLLSRHTSLSGVTAAFTILLERASGYCALMTLAAAALLTLQWPGPLGYLSAFFVLVSVPALAIAILTRLSVFSAGWASPMTLDRRRFVVIMALSLVFHLLWAGSIGLIVLAHGAEMDWQYVPMASFVSSTVATLPLSLGGIGLRESSLGGVLELGGLSSASAATISLTWGMAIVVVALLAGAVHLLHGSSATVRARGKLVAALRDAARSAYGVARQPANEARALPAEPPSSADERPPARQAPNLVALSGDSSWPSAVRNGAEESFTRLPANESAERVLSVPQMIAAAVVMLALIAGIVMYTLWTVIVILSICTAFYLFIALHRLYLVLKATSSDPPEITVSHSEVADLQEESLPCYSVLVPLFREENIVPQILHSIDSLDYPKDKLDVLLLVEPDDTPTLNALLAAALPSYISVHVVTARGPRSKPKALNHALKYAKGELCVLFDAEDQPEPDQLKKAVAVFRRSPENVACVQAKLNYSNAEQNILTRWFSVEYHAWFDVLLPGLHATSAPIPLGGTSNHFRMSVLKGLGGWDPFNVTEDADLGLRLYRQGWRTIMIESVTYEEANSRVGNWIRQRSRWIKGYMQTWLVHMRNPLRLASDLGPYGFFTFQMLIFGAIFSYLANPVFWVLTATWYLFHPGWLHDIYVTPLLYAGTVCLVAGNLAFVFSHMLAALRKSRYALVKYVIFMPVYWALMSVAAGKALLQLISRPHFWEKTDHGLMTGGTQALPVPAYVKDPEG